MYDKHLWPSCFPWRINTPGSGEEIKNIPTEGDGTSTGKSGIQCVLFFRCCIQRSIYEGHYLNPQFTGEPIWQNTPTRHAWGCRWTSRKTWLPSVTTIKLMNQISWGEQLSVSFRTSKRIQSRTIGICSSDHSDITLCVSSNRNPRISFGYNDPENPLIPCCGVFFFDTGELGKGSKKDDGVVFRIWGVSCEWFNVLICTVKSWF